MKITYDRSNSKIDVTHYFAMWLWIGWITFYLIFFTLVAPFLYFYNKYALSAILGFIILTMAHPVDPKSQPRMFLKLGEWIINKAADYFKMKMILEDEEAVRKAGQAMVAIEPHDILPLSIVGFTDATGALPGLKSIGCITSACFSIPLMRHVYSWVTAQSCDKKNMIRLLKNGYSTVLCPGGVQEVAHLDHEGKNCVLFLKSRLGFIKLAMQFGIPLIPAFTFGLRKSFTFWSPKSKWVQKLGRQFGVFPLVYFGLMGIPFGPANPCTYTTVVGVPIPMPKNDDPSENLLREYNTKFCAAMTKIFESNKDKYGMTGCELKIM